MINMWGYFVGNSVMYLIAGITGLLFHIIMIKKYTQLNLNSFWIYLFLNINNICLALSFSFAKIGSELLQITIINYLWTILIYFPLIYFVGYKLTNVYIFIFAILFAFVGICISCIGFEFSYLSDFFLNIKTNWYVYLFALGTVFSWSLYSTFIKKYFEKIQNDHIYISFIISGIFFLILSFVFKKHNNWNQIELNYISILIIIHESLIATLLPYYLWNIGYKHGDALFINRCSLFSPILNVIFTSIFYRLDAYINIFVGATCLIASAYLCKISLKNNDILETQSDKSKTLDIEQSNDIIQNNL